MKLLIITITLYSTALLAAQTDDNRADTENRYSCLYDFSCSQLQPTKGFNKEPYFRKLIQPVTNETDERPVKG